MSGPNELSDAQTLGTDDVHAAAQKLAMAIRDTCARLELAPLDAVQVLLAAAYGYAQLAKLPEDELARRTTQIWSRLRYARTPIVRSVDYNVTRFDPRLIQHLDRVRKANGGT